MIKTRAVEAFQPLTLGPDDILIVHLGIGNMPPGRVKEHSEEVRTLMKDMLRKGQQLMIFPKKEQDGIELQVLHIVV